MKKQLSLKRIVKALVIYLGSTILAYIINSFLDNLTINSLIMKTIIENFWIIFSVFALIVLLSFIVTWKIKDVINEYKEDRKKFINAINDNFRDHALKIHMIQRCMSVNNVAEIEYNHTNLCENDLLSIGYSQEKLIKAKEGLEKLRVSGDISKIKDNINYIHN